MSNLNNNYDKHMENEENQEQIKYLKNMFNCEYNILTIPMKKKNININHNFTNKRFVLNDDQYQNLKWFIKSNNLLPKTFFLGVYGFVMYKYSNNENVYTSIINEKQKNIINETTDIQPFLMKFGQNIIFGDLLKDINENILFYENNDIKFSDVSKKLNLIDMNNLFIFNSFENLNNNSTNISKNENNNSLEIFKKDDDLPFKNKDKFDIIFEVIEIDSQYIINFNYNDLIFKDYIIKSILESYVEVIKNMDNNINKKINDIEYITSVEKDRILKSFISNKCFKGKNMVFHVEFSQNAKEVPDKSAIIFEDKIISYKLLDEMSNSLAHYLRDYGIKRNDIVPLLCDRSYYFVVAALAVMKAGGAFVFIDPEFPDDRIQYLLKEVKTKLILGYLINQNKDNKLSKLNNSFSYYQLDKHNYNENTMEISNINDSNDVCCMFFTSGTTGQPKGVLITHKNLYNLCRYSFSINDGMNEVLSFESVLAFTKFIFNVSLIEIFEPLIHKHLIILCNNNEYNNPNLLSHIINKHNPVLLIAPPTRISIYLNNENFKKSFSKMKMLGFGGEVVKKEFLKLIFKYTNAIIYCGYGVTESTTMCTFNLINREEIFHDEIISMGKPTCNNEIYILDKFLKPVPIGVEGEIYISGFDLCKGYINNEELNKKVFINCPFSNDKNMKMYKTGDLGKWTSTGNIVHLGRVDFQVKIRGLRIELGEIESNIKNITEISYNVVIDKTNENNEKYLICYYITENEKINEKFIRNYLKNKIPLYMIPKYFVKINKIPVTVNGKLDRKALPEPTININNNNEYIPPKTKIENDICEIYSEIFKIDKSKIGLNSNFFELGGDSLIATSISTLIQKKFNIKINIRDIIYNPDLNDICQYIENIAKKNHDIYKVEMIKKNNNNKEFPITSQQLGIYLDSVKNNNSTIYNIPQSFKLNKNINIEKIKEGFIELFKNQEILRTKYDEKEINGKTEIFGYVDDTCSLTFENYTYENVNTFVRPFILSKAPLIRVGFIKDEILLIDIHHIISDGTSIIIIMNELNKYYNEEEMNMKETDIQYSDYAINYNRKKNSNYFKSQVEFYKAMFSNEYDILTIPEIKNYNNDLNETENESFILNQYNQLIDKSLSQIINEFIKFHSITKTAFFISIYGYILSKYSGQDTIYISMVSANRNNPYVDNMIGMFVSTLPLLLKYDDDIISFTELIKRNMKILFDIYNNQNISFSELSDILKLKKINNSFIFQPNIINKSNKISIIDNKENKNNTLALYENQNQLKNNANSKFDLLFSVIENDNSYKLSLEYNGKKYNSKIIKDIMNSYLEVIKNINNFENNIKNIEYIPTIEKEKIIKEFNSDINKFETEKLYHEEFCKIAHEYPDKCAVVYNEIKINYKELNEMSNSLAHYLRDQEVQRNDIIPIICDRSPYYIIAILGISKAGGAFLPIDKNLPVDRIKYILNDARPNIILYNNAYNIIETIKKTENYKTYDLKIHNYKDNINPIDNINEPDDTCYVLFTSGTTGKPKGTLVSHFNIYNYLRKFNNINNNENLSFESLLSNKGIKNILAVTNFTFDISHNEITYCLIHGLNIVLVDENTSEDLTSLSNYIINNKVDFINTTPSRFKLFMENENFRNSLKFIKAIVFIGEELLLNFCKYIHKFSDCTIYNGYGPTEATVTCTYKEINDKIENKITIGKPQCNYKLYILDKYMKPVPIGVEGEIYIGGYSVSKGYLHREELTKEKFISNPYNFDKDEHNKIIYRTGDLGKWTFNGEIEFLGRTDFQVKIHGQRIELGEIENTILEMNRIEQCAVIDKKREENDEKYLICYYVSSEEISNIEIRQYLFEKLPKYMVPNYYIKISEIPLSSSGKLNRKALPEPNKDDFITEKYVAPETELEKIICKIYSDIFSINENKIGKYTDFFKLGGDSLDAIRILNEIGLQLSIKITYNDLMNNSDICSLANLCYKIQNSGNNDNKVEIIKTYNSKEFPTSYITSDARNENLCKEMFYLRNLTSYYEILEDLDIEKLTEALNILVNRHTILKVKFIENFENGIKKLYGQIRDDVSIKIENYTKDDIDYTKRPPIMDITKELLIKVAIIENKILMIKINHIISDGYSFYLLINDLMKIYYGEPLDPLPYQFSDYAIYLDEQYKLNDYTDKINYYRTIFDVPFDIMRLSQRHEERLNLIEGGKVGRYRLVRIISDDETYSSIKEIIKNNNFSTTSYFVVILSLIFSIYSEKKNIYTGISTISRNVNNTFKLIGMFAKIILILIKFENMKLIEYINKYKEIINTLRSLDVPLKKLYNEFNLPETNIEFQYNSYITISKDSSNSLKNISDHELFQLLGKDERPLNEYYRGRSNCREIYVTVNEMENYYEFKFSYDSDLYEKDYFQNLINDFFLIVKNKNYLNENINDIVKILKQK